MFITSSTIIMIPRTVVGRAAGTCRTQATVAAAAAALNHSFAAAWSGQLSHASPESDFCSSASSHYHHHHHRHVPARTPAAGSSSRRSESTAAVWSNQISFSSPESDFCASPLSQSQSSSSSSNTTSSGVNPFSVQLQKSATTADQWSHSLSFSSPESDFCHPQQSQMNVTQLLPRTLAEAMHSPHACVVTTLHHPHQIVHVNAAWEQLCGYKQREALFQTLSILQGENTNTALADATVQRAAANARSAPEKADAAAITDMYVINYKKNGQAFTNHVTMSTMALSEDQPQVEFLVGVLQQVDHVPLRLLATA